MKTAKGVPTNLKKTQKGTRQMIRDLYYFRVFLKYNFDLHYLCLISIICVFNMVTESVGEYTFFSLFIYSGRESMSGGGAERERKRERIPSKPHAVHAEPNTGFKSTTMSS